MKDKKEDEIMFNKIKKFFREFSGKEKENKT